MLHDIALFAFPLIILAVSLFVVRKMFLSDGSSDVSVPRSEVADNFTELSQSASFVVPVKKAGIGGRLVTAGLFIACGVYLFTQNREQILAYLDRSGQVAQEHSNMARRTITPGVIEGHRVVDGVNWFRIIATGTDGVSFEGWINELAIHKAPPVENKMADSLMKKLGLPTNKERIDSIKKLRKVGSALKDSLADVKKQNL